MEEEEEEEVLLLLLLLHSLADVGQDRGQEVKPLGHGPHRYHFHHLRQVLDRAVQRAFLNGHQDSDAMMDDNKEMKAWVDG